MQKLAEQLRAVGRLTGNGLNSKGELEEPANYAVVDEHGTIVDIAWSGPEHAAEQGWHRTGGTAHPDHEGRMCEPTHGWSTPDGGVTWHPPALEPEGEADAPPA